MNGSSMRRTGVVVRTSSSGSALPEPMANGQGGGPESGHRATVVGPSPTGRRCREAADEGLASFTETCPSSVPFASLWGHLLPPGEGPNTISPDEKTEFRRGLLIWSDQFSFYSL